LFLYIGAKTIEYTPKQQYYRVSFKVLYSAFQTLIPDLRDVNI